MSDVEQAVLSKLKELGGESSAFLITNAEGPWGDIGDPDARMAAIKSLDAQGAVKFDAGNEVVTAT